MNVQMTQHELEEIYELQRDIAPKLKRLEELKQNVKILLVNKVPVELGRFDVQLLKRMVRNIPWKQAVVDNLGVQWAESYRKRFQPHLICDVLVEEHAVLPLWKNGSNSGSGEQN